MTFIATTAWYRNIPSIEKYTEEKSGLLEHGYRITRDYESATHFVRGAFEWILIKDFNKEGGIKNGRT